MTLRLVMEWPFVRRERSVLEIAAEKALARFEEVERRALRREGRDSISEIEEDIGGLVRDAKKLNGQ